MSHSSRDQPLERQQMLERAYGMLKDSEKAWLPYPEFHYYRMGYKMTFRGINAGMRKTRIQVTISGSAMDDCDVVTLVKDMQAHVRDQIRYQKILDQGLLIDLPILKMTEAAGLTPSHLVEKIRDRSDKDAAINIGGYLYKPTLNEGHISGEIAIDGPHVGWLERKAYARDLRLSETMLQSLHGKNVCEVIEHPFFEGLTVKQAKGKASLNLFVHEKPVPAKAFDIL